MYPIIYKFGILQIGGYGVMLGAGFYISFLLLERELRLRNINPELGYRILLTAIPGGIIGSKYFHILEHMDEFWLDPSGMLFSGAGLSAYGGFLLAAFAGVLVITITLLEWENIRTQLKKLSVIAVPVSVAAGGIISAIQYAMDSRFSIIMLFAHILFVLSAISAVYMFIKHHTKVLEVFDAAAPGMALGYCFGRFGCHMAGDGCFGTVTSMFLGTPYPNGIVASSEMVHPTPLYEVYFSFLVLALLMQLRKRDWPAGRLFYLYLILNGLPRFLVEFIRRNPDWLFALTQAQVVGIVLIVLGAAGMFRTYSKNRAQTGEKGAS